MFPLMILQPNAFVNSEGGKRKTKCSVLGVRLDQALLSHQLDLKVRDRVGVAVS